MKQAAKKYVKSYLWIVVASLIYAIGFTWFFEPNRIGFGGITGVGQIINHILPWAPIGAVVIVLNIPLFLLGWKLLGGHLLVSSLFAMLVSNIFIDLITVLHTFQPMGEPLLACIFGGVLTGLSLGIVFQQGATTGGTDLIARLLKLKLAWLPMGKLLMATDLVVLVAVSITFRNLYTALYGLVALYLSSILMDKVLYGMDVSKVAYIISSKPEEITQAVTHDLDRGVTILHGEGGWSHDEKKVLLVAFKQRQIVHIKEMVRSIDPAAFVIVCEAHEVMGEGFRQYKQNDI